MKKYLIDTSLLIHYLRGVSEAGEFIRQEPHLTISYVTVAELLQGARNKIAFQDIQDLTELFTVHWGSDKVNKLAVQLLEQYRLSHGAHLLDMLIGATALLSNLTLITDNLKDFQFIPDLQIQKPPYDQYEKAA